MTNWKQYKILVRYRTKSGANATEVTVLAESVEQALIWAEAKVRRQRGVIAVEQLCRLFDGDWATVKIVGVL